MNSFGSLLTLIWGTAKRDALEVALVDQGLDRYSRKSLDVEQLEMGWWPVER